MRREKDVRAELVSQYVGVAPEARAIFMLEIEFSRAFIGRCALPLDGGTDRLFGRERVNAPEKAVFHLLRMSGAFIDSLLGLKQ